MNVFTLPKQVVIVSAYKGKRLVGVLPGVVNEITRRQDVLHYRRTHEKIRVLAAQSRPASHLADLIREKFPAHKEDRDGMSVIMVPPDVEKASDSIDKHLECCDTLFFVAPSPAVAAELTRTVDRNHFGNCFLEDLKPLVGGRAYLLDVERMCVV